MMNILTLYSYNFSLENDNLVLKNGWISNGNKFKTAVLGLEKVTIDNKEYKYVFLHGEVIQNRLLRITINLIERESAEEYSRKGEKNEN